MSSSKRFFAVSIDEASGLLGRPDHTVFVQGDDGIDWAEATERPITGTFAVVGTTKATDSDPGTQWLGGAGDPWSRPPPLRAPGESLESYAARYTPTTVAEPPEM
jgi:hypothetical protein